MRGQQLIFDSLKEMTKIEVALKKVKLQTGKIGLEQNYPEHMLELVDIVNV